MNFSFHVIYGIILSIDELIFFKMVIAPPTRSLQRGHRWDEIIPLMSSPKRCVERQKFHLGIHLEAPA